MNPTDDLTSAASAWLTAVLPRLGADQLKACEEALGGRCDLRVVVRLRKGTVCLDAIVDAIVDAVGDARDRYIELYREDVAPLRPDDGFGQPDTNTRQ
jgi:hypothetical protein